MADATKKRVREGDVHVNDDDTPSQVKSLAVRFNDGNEIWRSPPCYCDDEFIWSPGWIEVLHITSSYPNDGLEKGKSSPRWWREFHPPCLPGNNGKSQIFHSLDEVKQFLSQQEAKQQKEKLWTDIQTPRRSSLRGFNPLPSVNHQQPSASSNLMPPSRKATESPKFAPAKYKEGTQKELQRIMNRNNKLSEAMRYSILHSAVLARKKDELYSDPKFLGVNGHIYPDLRLAFGKYTGVKPCAVCKQRVQGAFFCRLKHIHLEVPDYDGGNSAACLKELFQRSVSELEKVRASWGVVWGWRSKRNVEEDKLKEGTLMCIDGANWSMDRVSEDLLYHIASFLPSIKQLLSFCRTSKRVYHLLYKSVHSENLFRGTFLRCFGPEGTIGNFESNLTWRERWAMIKGLRRGLVLQTKLDISMTRSHCNANVDTRQLRETIGVLPPQEEREAFFYDNPHLLTTNRAHCNGYFGMDVLHLPPPPNAPANWRPPVVLRGDFNGIRIFESLEEAAFVHESSNCCKDHSRFVSLGHDEDGGQVLALIQCDLNLSVGQTNNDDNSSLCFFIGNASGRVASIAATLSDDGGRYTFSVSAWYHAHDNEITALTIVNCSATLDKYEPVLFSACCGGQVYFYPNALNQNILHSTGRKMEESLLAFTNYYDCPIYSMTSSVIHSGCQSLSVLCTGDRDGNVRLWLKPDVDFVGLCTSKSQKFRHLQVYKSSSQVGPGCHLVTRMKIIQNHLLVAGTNNGDVRIWQLQCMNNPSRFIGKGQLPKLSLMYDLARSHSGAVELMMNVGDILLTSGGDDGNVIGWDINTGLKLGCLRCHPGRHIEEGGSVAYSCVVEVVVSGKEGKLISICRDGVLRQWMWPKKKTGLHSHDLLLPEITKTKESWERE